MRTLMILVAAMMLAGCTEDSAHVEVGPPDAAQSFDGLLAVGQKLEVHVTVEHQEIEGSTTLDAVTLVTSNVDVVRSEPSGQGFYLFGVGPGTATIHATTHGFPAADFVVTVSGAP